MGIGNVLNRTFPQSTVRHTCPIKNGAGDGLFFTVREHKTLYKLAGFRSAASGKLLASIAGSFEEREKEGYAEYTFSVDNWHNLRGQAAIP